MTPSQNNTIKKILVTGGKGMLAYDFFRSQKERYEIILTDREECDITSFESVLQCIDEYAPDVLLNCAAYTAVDDAEDIGMKLNYDVNTLGAYNLARATSIFGVEYITLSTDYVFDGRKKEGYLPTDSCNPVNAYGMAKYLGERLALDVNPRTVIIRTSWLYGGKIVGQDDRMTEGKGDRMTGGQNDRMTEGKGDRMIRGAEENNRITLYGNFPTDGIYKNFVNTMLRLSETRDEVRVIDDQHGRPTSCIDLSRYIASHIDLGEDIRGGIYHFSSPREESSITWADFAEEIFRGYGRSTRVIRCSSAEYPTKARRPEWSVLL